MKNQSVRTTQNKGVKAVQETQKTVKQTTKTSIKTTKQAAKATAKPLIAAGGWIAVAVIIVICLIVLLLGSVFGIFFSGEDSGTGMSYGRIVSGRQCGRRTVLVVVRL